MKCEVCGLRFWATECPACRRGSGPEAPLGDRGLQPWESIDSLLIDFERRGRLVVTISRIGPRIVQLLPPRAQM